MLDVWYPDDVIRILAALASAGELQGPEYHKALGDVALAFGIGANHFLTWCTVDAEAVAMGDTKTVAPQRVHAGAQARDNL